MTAQYDLILVGGGLAGSTLARAMAERGARVLVVDRDREFQDRVRGEFMESWGVAEARKLGIDSLLREQVAHELRWVDLFSWDAPGIHRDIVATTPQQLPCFSFYHPAMQEALIGAAARAGAEVRRGVGAVEVRPGVPPGIVVQSNGHTEEFRARLVVGADGRSSTVRKSAGFQLRRDPERMLLAGVLLDNVHAPEDAGLLVVNANLGRIALVLPQGRGRARTYLGFHKESLTRFQGETHFPRYIEECMKTGVNLTFYEGAKIAGPLATFDGADTWVDHPYREGAVLVGDAAAATDPTWGQGLSLTLRDVRVLRDHLLATEDWDAAGHAYAREHDRYYGVIHTITGWFTDLDLGTGPEAEARRARALPRMIQDPARRPDLLFSGPDMPADETVKRRFFCDD